MVTSILGRSKFTNQFNITTMNNWKHSIVFKPSTNFTYDELQQWSHSELVERVKLLQDYINNVLVEQENK